jgi:hypothetical protein
VRSVGDFQAIACDVSSPALGVGGGESRLEGPATAKETILELEHTKSVSMPSELLVDAGCDADLAVRVGSVKERRLTAEPRAGACSRVFEEAGDDMLGASGSHSQSAAVEVEVALGVRIYPCVCKCVEGLRGLECFQDPCLEFHRNQRISSPPLTCLDSSEPWESRLVLLNRECVCGVQGYHIRW